jgi:hypothetical protein
MGNAWNAIEKIQGILTSVRLNLNTAMNAGKIKATDSGSEATPANMNQATIGASSRVGLRRP